MTPTPRESLPISDPLQAVTDKVRAIELPKSRPNETATDDGERIALWKRLVASRGKRYEESTLQSYQQRSPAQKAVLASAREYAASMVDRVKRGESIVFFGPPGTGKDHLMMGLMRVATLRDGLVVKWINGQQLWSWFRDAIDGTKSEIDLMSDLTGCQVLAISDPLPQWGTLTPYQANCLFRILDHRYSNLRPTWITANVASGKEAEERIGAAIVDRLRDQGHAWHCNWESYRKVSR